VITPIVSLTGILLLMISVEGFSYFYHQPHSTKAGFSRSSYTVNYNNGWPYQQPYTNKRAYNQYKIQVSNTTNAESRRFSNSKFKSSVAPRASNLKNAVHTYNSTVTSVTLPDLSNFTSYVTPVVDTSSLRTTSNFKGLDFQQRQHQQHLQAHRHQLHLVQQQEQHLLKKQIQQQQQIQQKHHEQHLQKRKQSHVQQHNQQQQQKKYQQQVQKLKYQNQGPQQNKKFEAVDNVRTLVGSLKYPAKLQERFVVDRIPMNDYRIQDEKYKDETNSDSGGNDDEDHDDGEDVEDKGDDDDDDDDEYEDDNDEEDPETASGLLEGDIALSPEGKYRLSIDFGLEPARRWTNNTIPYKISSKHTPNEILVIESAMQTIGFLSCVKFRVWDGKESDYLMFHPHSKNKGCWSNVGRVGGKQQVSLEQPTKKSCKCFCSAGRALHEIMHTLGFYHEHSRSDRDDYIKIIKSNVKKGKMFNFNTKSDDESSRNFNYDYDSIMHYGSTFFSKNKRDLATIVPKKPGVTIGQREMLSRTDCMKVNALYNCLSEEDSSKNRKIQILCAMVGF